MDWIQMKIITTGTGIEPVCGALYDMGITGVEISDKDDFREFLENNRKYWDYVDDELAQKMHGLSQIRLYLERSADVPERVSFLTEQLAGLRTQFPQVDFGSLMVVLQDVRDEDWENNWKQYYQPLPIGRSLLVVPQWLQPENPEHRTEIRLDPGMIFGTGAHASTQMCMRALEHCIAGGERVLDLGSGSGILSITALKLGAKSAVGVDIDPKAEDIARENAAMNDLFADRFTAVTGDVIADAQMPERLGGGYDVVLANIVADVIIPLAPHVPQFLKPGGIFICSGILDVRLHEVHAALKRAGLHILSTDAQEDWRRVAAIWEG